MHEVAIAASALSIALERAQQARATRIARVCVRVGALSGVDPDSFRFAFDAAKSGTAADAAALEIETPAAVAHCSACDREFEVADDFIALCPACGRVSADIRRGRELELTRVQLTE